MRTYPHSGTRRMQEIRRTRVFCKRQCACLRAHGRLKPYVELVRMWRSGRIKMMFGWTDGIDQLKYKDWLL